MKYTLLIYGILYAQVCLVFVVRRNREERKILDLHIGREIKEKEKYSICCPFVNALIRCFFNFKKFKIEEPYHRSILLIYTNIPLSYKYYSKLKIHQSPLYKIKILKINFLFNQKVYFGQHDEVKTLKEIVRWLEYGNEISLRQLF